MNPINNYIPSAQAKRKLRTLYIIIAILLTIVAVQQYRLRHADDLRVLKQDVDQDLHSVIISYRDTVAVDHLTDADYQKLINDIHLPKGDE